MATHPARSPEDSFDAPRRRFLDALSSRLDALDEALTSLEADAASATQRAQLRRRLQAMSEASGVLGFELLGAAFASAESSLACASDPGSTERAIADVRRTLSLVPSMVEHAEEAVAAPASGDDARGQAVDSTPEPQPHRVVVLGTLASHEAAVTAVGALDDATIDFTVDLHDALDLAGSLSRPTLVLDGRHRDAGRALDVLGALGPCVVVGPAPQLLKRPGVRSAHSVIETFDELPAHLLATTESSAEPALTAPQHPGRTTSNGRRQPGARVDNLPGRTILVADADPAMAWFLVGVLRSAQAEVLEARDGLEAWRLARERTPDLIVSDVSLPELDGFGLCRNVKHDVVLGDVPVLLVSWKEDALQRARELGAGADGYFLKEADASTILRRCAEVLEPRANVERRLRTEDRVPGRLNGMTPRLVLRLTCDIVDNARVHFEDAGYHYEVYVGDGRILSARRTAQDGCQESGETVLPALLGMRAGRFIVERTGEVVQSSFTGSMSALLAPHIARTRRAVRVLQGGTLHKVARLELDEGVLAPYLTSSPPIVQQLVRKLNDDVAPAALMRSVSAGLVESVLTDLALRGGVRRALDMDGVDVLDDGDAYSQPFDLEVRTPTAGFQVVAARGAPRVDRNSSQEEALEAAEFAGAIESKPLPIVTHASEVILPRSDPHRTSRIPLPDRDAEEPETGWAPTQAELHALSDALPDADDLGLAASCDAGDALDTHSSAPEALAPLPDRVEAEANPDSSSDDEQLPTTSDSVPSLPPQPHPEPPGPAAEIELGVALFGELSGTPSPEPARPATAEPKHSESSKAPMLREHRITTDELLVADSLKEPTRHAEDDFVDDGDPLFDSLHAELPSSPNPRHVQTTQSGTTTPPKTSLSPRDGARAATLRATAWVGSAKRAAGHAVEWAKSRQRASAVIGADVGNPLAHLPPPFGDGPEPAVEPEGSPLPNRPSQDLGDSTANAKSGPELDKASRSRLRRVVAAGKRVAVPAAALLTAAGVAFGVMGVIVEKLQSETPTESALALPEELEQETSLGGDTGAREFAAVNADDGNVANPDVAPPTKTTLGPRLEMHSIDLPLPDGIQVAPEKGLLEINTAGDHKIYVGGVFVGRGPVRRVPLAAGAHQVQLRLDGDEDSVRVVVTSGRRVRVEPVTRAAITP